MSASMDPRPFKFLVKLAVRAFYPGPCPPKDYQGDKEERGGTRASKLDKLETKGLAMILMDYLIDQEWVSEDQLLTDLNLHHKLVRRALKFLQEEHLLMSEHRRETKRMRASGKDAVVNVMSIKAQEQQALQELQDGSLKRGEDEDPDEVMEVQKQHTFSYWAVDLPRAFDMIQLRLHVMRQLLKDELDAKEEVGRYICKSAHCIKQYDAFDIPDILQLDGSLQCMMCGGVVEQVFVTGQTGDDEQRKLRKERCRRVQQEMEGQLEALLKLVVSLRHAQPPFLGSLHDWALNRQRAAEAAKAEAEGRGPNAQRSRGGGITILAPPSAPNREHEAYRETHVQVTLADGLSEAHAPQLQQHSRALATKATPGVNTAAPAAAAATTAVKTEGTAGVAAAKPAAGGRPKAPSAAQPFFLRGSAMEAAPQAPDQARAAAAAIPGVLADAEDGVEWMDEQQGALQGAGESKEQMDAYTAHMLASLGASQQQLGSTSKPELAAGGLWGAQGSGSQLKSEGWNMQEELEERAGKRARLDVRAMRGCSEGVAAPKKEAEEAAGAYVCADAGAAVKTGDEEAEWEDI